MGGDAGRSATREYDDGYDVEETFQPQDILGQGRAAGRGVFTTSANGALRRGLRFRYHPRAEAGHSTLTLRRKPKGSISADGFKLSVLFYLR